MITPDQLLPRILEACPSFAPVWKSKKAAWWDKKKREWLHYVVIYHLAEHLLDRYAAGSPDDLKRCLSLTETLLADGDPEVQELTVIGIFEDIQNIALSRSLPLGPIREGLGRRSTRAWDKVMKNWGRAGRAPRRRPGTRGMDPKGPFPPRGSA